MSNSRSVAPSVLDTKETFRQKSAETSINTGVPNPDLPTFFKSLYKVRNYRLADALEKSHFSENPEVLKVIRNLRFCNSVSVIENTNGSIYRMNMSCKNKFCYLCCRAKSAKLSSRMMALLDDKFTDRAKYHFYFLTLTLQHNDKVRRSLYLKELKDLMNKLYKSKLFTTHFTSDRNKKVGIIQAIENKITKKGNHIHSHNLIMSNKIKIPVNQLESLIREKWKRLSKGSYQIKLDLVRSNNKNSNDVLGAVKELFKYSIKTDDSNRISNKEADRIAYWIIKTKGQNMINARGLLRGHGITALKCKYDEKPERNIDNDSKYFLVRPSKLVYNYSLYKKSSKEERSLLKKDVKLLDMPGALDITSVADDIEFVFSQDLKANEIFDVFDKRINEKYEYDNTECWFDGNTKEVIDKSTGEVLRREFKNHHNGFD